MFRDFDYIELGGTMYTPAISPYLIPIASGEKFPFLKSVVFCLEDSIKEEQISTAMENVQNFLYSYKKSNIKVFIRPRDINNFRDLISLNWIEKIDGFSLAKFGLANMEQYFKILNSLENKFHIMPIIESSDMFDIDKLKSIREFLVTQKKHSVITLRIGGEDMFKTLGLKKSCEDSIHDFHISSKLFADLFSVFKPYGFNLAAPVYNCLSHEQFLIKEIQRDIKEGFFGKTIIHPNQAKACNKIYKVSNKELEEAKAILDSSNQAIFKFDDKMCELEAHQCWARNIIKRSEIYGTA